MKRPAKSNKLKLYWYWSSWAWTSFLWFRYSVTPPLCINPGGWSYIVWIRMSKYFHGSCFCSQVWIVSISPSLRLKLYCVFSGLKQNCAVRLYLTQSRCVNILQVFEECPRLLLMLPRVAQIRAWDAQSVDVRGCRHCSYPFSLSVGPPSHQRCQSSFSPLTEPRG